MLTEEKKKDGSALKEVQMSPECMLQSAGLQQSLFV
jgi:hypothetical protein